MLVELRERRDLVQKPPVMLVRENLMVGPIERRDKWKPDLPRVAYGRTTAGAIRRLSLQCWSQPERITRVGYRGSDWAAIEALTGLWRAEGLRPAWMAFFPTTAGPCLVAELEERAIPLEAWSHCTQPVGYEELEVEWVSAWAAENLFGTEAAQPEFVTIEGAGLAAAVEGLANFRGWAARPDGITVDGHALNRTSSAQWQAAHEALDTHLGVAP